MDYSSSTTYVYVHDLSPASALSLPASSYPLVYFSFPRLPPSFPLPPPRLSISAWAQSIQSSLGSRLSFSRASTSHLCSSQSPAMLPHARLLGKCAVVKPQHAQSDVPYAMPRPSLPSSGSLSPSTPPSPRLRLGESFPSTPIPALRPAQPQSLYLPPRPQHHPEPAPSLSAPFVTTRLCTA
jgi:hypothetical protein